MQMKIIGFWGGYPGPGEATSAYLIEKNDYALMLDFGSGALATLQKYKDFLAIDAILLSHYHHDHVADIGVLQYARLVQSYLREDVSVLPIYGHQEDEKAFSKLTDDYTKGVAYKPQETLQIGPYEINFMKTKHPVPCYGMRITDGEKTIVYTADSAYDEKWFAFAKDAHVLIADCNFYAGQDGLGAGHMNSQEIATIASQAQVGELIVSHLPHFGEHEQLVKEASEHFSGKITLAHEGYTWI